MGGLRKVVVTKIARPSAETVALMRAVTPAFICDYLGKHRCFGARIKPMRPGARICGVAITCLGPDLSVRKMAIDLAEQGDILVVAALGESGYACFGYATALRAANRGVTGVVVDGYTRDSALLRSFDLPVFALGSTPRNFDYPFGLNHGGVNVDVSCCGVTVCPGDIIIGDDDGVVAVPRTVAEREAKAMLEEYSKIEERHLLNAHRPYNVGELLKEAGYEFE